MPELRKDYVTDTWVVFSAARAHRPGAFKKEKLTTDPAKCPFCYGHEPMTPPEILAYRKDGQPNGPGWWIRCVPNKFPALQIEGEVHRRVNQLFHSVSGVGAHEVIVETPEHEATLATLPEERVEEVLWAFRDRIVDLKKDPRFQYILVFKNHGEAAGASLEHPHCQLIATPIIPKRVREEVDGAREYYRYKERCVYCDMVRQERQERTRLITENDHFVALAPFASRRSRRLTNSSAWARMG